MIAGKSAGLIYDLVTHVEQTALLNGKPSFPSKANHGIYLPLIKKYILLERTLNQFFTD